MVLWGVVQLFQGIEVLQKCYLVFASAVVVLSAKSEQIPDSGAIHDTISQINHANLVVAKIRHRNNALVLEEKYEKFVRFFHDGLLFRSMPSIWRNS